MRPLKSVAGKLILLTIIFIGVPILVYMQFQAADKEKTELLIHAVKEQGSALAMSLKPALRALTPKTFTEITKQLSELKRTNVNIKLLLWPHPLTGSPNFFYIGAVPQLTKEYRDQELEDLKNSSIFKTLDDNCVFGVSSAHRYVNPAGEGELITSVNPVSSPAGCWLILTSNLVSDFGGADIEKPYWSRPQVRLSLTIYTVMAAIVFALWVDVRRNLLQFTRLARDIRRDGDAVRSFRAINNIPELDGVAVEFDRMVASLTTSADAIRSSAEETAHALKTPIGVLVQAIEPLRRALRPDDERAYKSIERIEMAIGRLSDLVDRNRKLGKITADTLNPRRVPLDINSMIGNYVEMRRKSLGISGPLIDVNTISERVTALGNQELLESAVDNLIDNAISFSQPGDKIIVTVGRSDSRVIISVSDQGPGVDPAQVEHIFERNYTFRQAESAADHDGLGLWIVRRNTMSLGGKVYAENLSPRGFRVSIELPAED